MPVPRDHFEKQHLARERIAELRQEAFAKHGCGYWTQNLADDHCTFPLCRACYQFWSPQYRPLWNVD